jgi:hypothetical protein
VLAKQDSVAEQGEARAAVHLPHDLLGGGVHALGPAVVEWQGEAGVDGGSVEVDAAGESMQVR